jgi:hypothetical protein
MTSVIIGPFGGPSRSESQDGHLTGTVLYGVLVPDASLGGLKGLSFLREIRLGTLLLGNVPENWSTSGAHPLS